MTQTVGIDLGTTNSAVSRIVGEDPAVLTVESGEKTMPSVVGFDSDGTVQVGRQAVKFGKTNPDRVVESVKRRMGETEPVATINGEGYLPEEISALILKNLKNSAENELGSDITNAVITVPAYFTDVERDATKRAGEIAGLTVDRIINEPIAAALSYGINHSQDRTIMVYDLGGGTFDVSIVEASDGVFEVIATDGLSEHGGDDWDARLAGKIVELIENDIGYSIKDDPQQMGRVWRAAQRAKHDLSNRNKITISIPTISNKYDFEQDITRENFANMTSDLLEKTIEVCQNVLTEEGLSENSVDEILLVGGSTRMPQIKSQLESKFDQTVRRSSSPDEVVAKGAAIQAGIIHDKLPAIKESGSDVLKTREERSMKNTDAEEYSLPDTYDDIVVIDVVSRSLGVQMVDDRFARMIPKNTTIPVEETNRFHTVRDNQRRIKVSAYQGESMTASKNKFLDEFVITGIPPQPAGQAEIDITFRIDESGILNLRAKSIDAGHSEAITIQSGIDFTEEEMSQMKSSLPVIEGDTQ